MPGAVGRPSLTVRHVPKTKRIKTRNTSTHGNNNLNTPRPSRPGSSLGGKQRNVRVQTRSVRPTTRTTARPQQRKIQQRKVQQQRLKVRGSNMNVKYKNYGISSRNPMDD